MDTNGKYDSTTIPDGIAARLALAEILAPISSGFDVKMGRPHFSMKTQIKVIWFSSANCG